MQRITQLFDKAPMFYNDGDPSHDLAHIRRVVAMCERLGKAEGADLDILLAAAILHDIVNLPKNHPERTQASQMAAAKSRAVLLEVGFSDAEIERISTVITEHSYSRGAQPTSIESAILQDSDKLDAIGAIGIMRTVTSGCRFGASYYHPTDPFATDRALDDKRFTLDHFYEKLLKLADKMNTPAAKAEAQKRVSFMHTFLQQLRSEIEGSAISRPS